MPFSLHPILLTSAPTTHAGDGWVHEAKLDRWRCLVEVSNRRLPLWSGRGGDYTDLGGLAVHIAARAASLAAPGEVLVSSTVKDLVTGSGIDFVDRGEHQLKRVPETCKLYRAVS